MATIIESADSNTEPAMKIKIKPIDGPSMTIEVKDTWTIQRLSVRYCNGQALAAGYPLRVLDGGSIVSEVLANGDLIRVLNEWMNDATERIMRKKEKRMERNAEQESAEAEGKAEQELPEIVPLPDDLTIHLPTYDFAIEDNLCLVEEFPPASPEKGNSVLVIEI